MPHELIDLDERLQYFLAHTDLSHSTSINDRSSISLASATFDAESSHIAFQIDAPIRNQGVRQTTVDRNSHPELYRLLSCLMMSPDSSTLPNLALPVEALVDVGLLLRADQVPLPIRLMTTLEIDDSIEALSVTPGRSLLDHARSTIFADNTTDRTLSWVYDHDRHLEWPYWLTSQQACELSRSRRCSDEAIKTEPWVEARRSLHVNGYAVVRSLLPVSFVRGLQSYYRRLFENSYLARENNGPQRFGLHNEPLAKWLHRHTESYVSRLIADPILRFSCYARCYGPGSSLSAHTDRAPYTLSLVIDAVPDATRDHAWPLYFHRTDRTDVSVLLAPGDGVIFQGRELSHYRTPLPDYCRSTLILFRYIPTTFSGFIYENRGEAYGASYEPPQH